MAVSTEDELECDDVSPINAVSPVHPALVHRDSLLQATFAGFG